jgi:hypothetical protein
MSLLRLPNSPIAQLRNMDPRRSLVAGIIWLMIALAASFAVAASIWAGRVAREIVVQQHVRRLALETEQLASDLGQAVSARLDALRAAGNSASPAESFQRLREAYPELGWIAAADINGTVLAADDDIVVGGSASREPWFSRGLQGPWIGMIEEIRRAGRTPLLGDLSAPVKDASGRVVGVIAAHLNWRWALSDVRRLSDTPNSRGSAQMAVLDRAATVLVGPDALLNGRWGGIVLEGPPPLETPPALRSASALAPTVSAPTVPRSSTPRFERLPDGATVLVARAPVSIGSQFPALGWQVQLSEPKELVYQRANALGVINELI